MRSAADELRAELAGEIATFVVNRNVNFTNVCTVGCAFCGFGQGRRSPDAYEVEEADFRERIREAVEFGATEICMQGGIHPDYTLERLRRAGCELAKEVAPEIHLHAYSPMEVHFMCERSGRAPDGRLRLPDRECGLGSTPGHGRRGARRRGPAADLAEQAARRPLGRDHRGLPPAGPALHLDGDVRPHRGAVGAGRAHAGDPRVAGAHRRHHRVRAAQLHPLPTRCSVAPTGSRRSRDDENLKHTAAFRLALGQLDPQPAGELGEDGPRCRHRGAALGSQRPRRDADGGEHLADGRLAPRRPPRARGADRRGEAAGRTPAQRTTLYEIVETY